MMDMYIGSGLALDNSVLRRVFEYGERIAECWRKCRMKSIQLTEYYCGDLEFQNRNISLARLANSSVYDIKFGLNRSEVSRSCEYGLEISNAERG